MKMNLKLNIDHDRKDGVLWSRNAVFGRNFFGSGTQFLLCSGTQFLLCSAVLQIAVERSFFCAVERSFADFVRQLRD